MADDPYKILGVPRTSSDDEVRRAYLKLVKELHPDVNPSRAAEERFKKVTAAFDLLGDPDKRRQFDRGEIDASGEQQRYSRAGAGGPGAGARWSGGGFPGFDSEDPFADIFAGLRGAGAGSRGPNPGRAPKGQDVRYTLDVDFLEAALGAKKRITLPGGAALDLTIQAGSTDGKVLRLKGKGQPSPMGGEPGDALVEIKVRPHGTFKRKDDDILYDCPLTLDEAVLGAKVEVPTISGRVQLSIPRGTQSGRVFRLKGKGIANAASGTTGDQLVTVRIMLPETIDTELEQFLTAWRQKNSYDPGRA
jgi:DnaJ-class molecular chaperone